MSTFNTEIARLEGIHRQGLLTNQEFENKKADLLAQHNTGAVIPSAGPELPPGAASAPAAQDPVVRCRGLPFTATEADVAVFFGDCQIVEGGIKFVVSADGRHNGICYVEFLNSDEVELKALPKNKSMMGTRYIEIFRSSRQEMLDKTRPPEEAFWVRMRGLPFSAGKEEVKQFFAEFPILDHNVTMTQVGGRPSGEAFVQFSDEVTAKNAMTKDRQMMGERYVELFLVTQADVNAAVSKSRRSSEGYGRGWGGGGGGRGGGRGRGRFGGGGYHPYQPPQQHQPAYQGGGGYGPPTGYAQQPAGYGGQQQYGGYQPNYQMGGYAQQQQGSAGGGRWASQQAAGGPGLRYSGTGGGGGDPRDQYQYQGGMGGQSSSMGYNAAAQDESVVKLRGLPYKATTNDIAQFFSGIDIQPGGVRIQYGHDGRPSGQAYVALSHPSGVSQALARHKQNMGERWIEVFPCSAQEMNSAVPSQNAGGQQYQSVPGVYQPAAPSW